MTSQETSKLQDDIARWMKESEYCPHRKLMFACERQRGAFCSIHTCPGMEAVNENVM